MGKMVNKNSLKRTGVYVIISTLIISLIMAKGFAFVAQTETDISSRIVLNSVSGKGVDIILYEDFEDGIIPPDGWELIQYNANETWHINESAHSGSYCVRCDYDENYSDIQDEWLITPCLNFSGYDELYLSFWWSHSYYWGVDPYDNYDLNVYIAVDGGTWEPIWNEDNIGNFSSYEWYDTMFGEHINLSEYTGENDIEIGFQYYGFDGMHTSLDDITIGPPGEPNLECEGSLSWSNVRSNAIVYGNFSIKNIGDHASLLDWEITEWPTWGNWTFTPLEGENLTPETGIVTVEVEIIAPNKQNEGFTGEIKIVNKENSSDYCEINVYLKTPRTRISHNPLFLQSLERLLERFPNAFPILRLRLGLQ